MNEIKKDKFGPEYVIEVYDPKIGMNGFLIIDNTALGVGKGGMRMTPNVTKEEVFRLARTMTWKNALAGIPFGGAKAGIVWNGGNDNLKKQFIQSFTRAIRPFLVKKYIAGPDVNTGENEMRWIVEAAGNIRAATGKPSGMCYLSDKKCGLPHELGSTGYGVAESTCVIVKILGLDIRKTTVAIEGFGNVGEFTLRHLSESGAKIVAVTDIIGGVYDKNGLVAEKLLELKARKKSPAEYGGGKKIKSGEIFGLPVDIFIPAAVTDTINDKNKNKNKIKTKIIVEAANIPMRESVENELFKKGKIIVPDFVANAGGVISSYAEYKGYGHEKMFRLVKEKIGKSTEEVMRKSIKENKNPRHVAMEMAIKIVEEKMKKISSTL